ncbi:hypothetical protein [Virgibacillus pantothenticus]|uniref:hypothetical protein n=1 Tax=Virgibacillus pantothenticus TaxID=1473 RepID=UPI0011158FEB|nr:hypothetical protein [Virgibacillus pantothenticus]
MKLRCSIMEATEQKRFRYLTGVKERNDDKWAPVYDFRNYITFGAFDAGKNIGKGLQEREETKLRTPVDFAD